MKKATRVPARASRCRYVLLLASVVAVFTIGLLVPGPVAAATQPVANTTRHGVDYSLTNVDWPDFFGQLKASGRDFIGRYLPWKGAAWRQVTIPELEAATAAGVDYFFWFEDSNDHFRARDGFAVGAADAQEALRGLASLGLPTTTPVYYTVDFPASDGGEIDAYFRGIASVVPVSQIGVYGNYTTIDWLYQHGLANYFCESNAWPEPQGWHPQAQMHQDVDSYSIGGVHVDRLAVTATDFGQCPRPKQPEPPFHNTGTFTDISASPYKTAIESLAQGGGIGGYSDGTFRPQNPVLRTQFAKMICLGLGLRVKDDPTRALPFHDVVRALNDPYPDDYIAVAAADGLIQGTGNGHFGPYLDITRAQLLTIVVRAAQRFKPSGVLGEVPVGWHGILPATDPIHGRDVALAEYSGLLTGIDLTRFSIWGKATRGEVAQLIWNLKQK